MSFSNLMLLKAVVCLVFGILLIAIPDILISVLGAALGAAGMFTARAYGAALFGNLFLCWYARNAGVSDARSAIILALFVYDLIGFIVTIITLFLGVLNLLGLFIAFIYLFFTFGFGYFMVKTPEAETA